MKANSIFSRYSIIFLALFMAFYSVPGYLVISGQKFDTEIMVYGLLIILNCGVSLVTAGYDTWTKGFCWPSVVLPPLMFLPSAFIFYGGSTTALIFCVAYLVLAGVADAFTYYVRLMHQRRRKL